MSATSEEIISACATLRLSEDAVRQVHSSEAAKELERIAEQFARGTSQRWWWECFDAATSVTFRDQMGFARITRIVPDERAQLWFVVEDDVDPFLPTRVLRSNLAIHHRRVLWLRVLLDPERSDMAAV